MIAWLFDGMPAGSIYGCFQGQAHDPWCELAPGRLADLLLLDANPLENIRNTQWIWRIIEDGHVFDPETLRRPT